MSFESEAYRPRPLVVRGRGAAGAGVIAAVVLPDVMWLVQGRHP